MKKLTYKILKEDTSEKQKIEFNRDFYLNELKKEIGLPEIPYEKLNDYKVQLNSPTGRSCSFEVNAKDYVDKELENIERDIDKHNSSDFVDPEPTFDLVTINVDEKQEALIRKTIENSEDFWEWVEDKPELIEIKQDQSLDNFVYFDVKLPAGPPYTVVIYNNKTQDILDQINLVRKHLCTVGPRKRDMLTGYETIINYYQWVNLVSALDIQNKDHMTYEDISARMDNIFTGVEGIDLPEGFL